MTRQIKFRAWDKNEEKMYEPSGILNDVVSDDSEIHLMQFTGLLDSKGKEIYEGDILSGHEDGVVQVVWRSAGWECDFADNGNISLDEMCVWFGNKAEIIGNIYEHPNLLK